MVGVNHDGLWKKLIDTHMKKKDLTIKLNIGTGTIAKMSKGASISLEVLARICLLFDCNIGNIVRFIYE